MSKSKLALLANTPFNPIPVSVEKLAKGDHKAHESTSASSSELSSQMVAPIETSLKQQPNIPSNLSGGTPPWLDFDPAEEPYFLRLKDVMCKTGLAKSTIYLHASLGKFPRSRTLNGERVAIWDSREVRAYIRFQLSQS